MCSIVLGGATWGCVGAAVELQLSSYAMGWCVGFEGGFAGLARGFAGLRGCYLLWGVLSQLC